MSAGRMWAGLRRRINPRAGGALDIISAAEVTPAPDHGDTPFAPPVWEPDIWNNPATFWRVNCYAYAINDPFDHTTYAPQPGYISGLADIQKARLANDHAAYIAAISAGAVADGMIPLEERPRYRPGFYLVALAFDLKFSLDYHWYRQDADGFWSHKPADNFARRTDRWGRIISNPETAPRGRYHHFHGWYLVPNGGLRSAVEPKLGEAAQNGMFPAPGSRMLQRARTV